MTENFRLLPCGDSAVTVEFGDSIRAENSAKVSAFTEQLNKQPLSGIMEIIPTYRSVTICFDPTVLAYEDLEKQIRKAAKRRRRHAQEKKRIFILPVAYGSEFGPDLQRVADHAGISPIEVVRRHATRIYRIDMIGFLPGFPYLSEMDPTLETPRLVSPRTVIPTGAVGIGGKQTGVYPMESPGGWNLIGRTPLLPYDPSRTPPVPYQTGDYIRFLPILRAEYERLAKAVAAGDNLIPWEEG